MEVADDLAADLLYPEEFLGEVAIGLVRAFDRGRRRFGFYDIIDAFLDDRLVDACVREFRNPRIELHFLEILEESACPFLAGRQFTIRFDQFLEAPGFCAHNIRSFGLRVIPNPQSATGSSSG